MERLKKKGIDSRPFFYPMHQLPMFKSKNVFPVSDNLSGRGINLPSATTLTDSDIRTVCEALASLKSD
jgi:perosamine synthetase